MPPDRLSALDASFLAAETEAAHMHVGWRALFEPPAAGSPPSFEELRDHVATRLGRAQRYRQRLAPVPFGVHDPVWVDDERFDIDHHVLRGDARNLDDLADVALSSPLERSRPLWELWIAERLADGRIGVVGKAHHCLVDGLAAVELAALMLDPTPQPQPPEDDGWQPAPAPSAAALLARGLVDRVYDELDLARLPAQILTSPRRQLPELAVQARRAALALGHAFAPPAPMTRFNEASSSLRRLRTVSRPLDDLRRINAHHRTTINDVVLAVCAGGVRRYLQQHGDRPVRLKAMLPVSVRETGTESDLGNHISFIFLELPSDEPDAVARLHTINAVTTERKHSGEALGADTVAKLVAHTPLWLQRATTRLVASPRTFNLAVSNIPGPTQPLYMRGCRLVEAHPAVPLADRHAVAIGTTTIAERACFGVYADRKALPDVDLLAHDIDAAIDELLAHSTDGHRGRRPKRSTPVPA